MARKRPKASTSLSTATAAGTSIPTRPKAKSPRRKTRRANENFEGKLSHASPVSPNSKITKYFHPQEDELCSSQHCGNDLSLPTTPMILRTSPRKLLTQANLNTSVIHRGRPLPPALSGHDGSPPKTQHKPNGVMSPQLCNSMPPPPAPTEDKRFATPHKITSPPAAILSSRNSPSSALSTLSINSPQSNVSQPVGTTNKKSKRCLNPVIVPAGTNSTNQVSQSRITEFFPVRRSIRKTKKIVLQERQKSLEEAVLNNQEEGLEVHMFEGKGRGVVTNRKFYRGEFVVEYAGQLITMEVAKQREKLYAQDQNTGCYMYYFRHGNSQYCIDATAESPRLGRLVNHSRFGNLATKTIEINCEPHLVLIAKEDIEPGTEITYDYGDRSKESLRHHPWLLN
uniref:[histone H4]-lysine(20) N-methyltransferase n=1 Tax=Cacopsylla melanoneura TaxID=428564 RepID=A0A8D9FBB5_9HEMI